MTSPAYAINTDPSAGVKAQKEKERKFREGEIPFGEHVSIHRQSEANIIELQNVLNFLSIEDSDVLLDIGCSDGRLLEYLHRRRPRCRLVGIDFALNPLRKLREKTLRAHSACADVCELPFREGSFSRAVSVQVIQHIPSIHERGRALREIYEILKPGATFVLTVLNRNTGHSMVENGMAGPLITSPELYVYLYDASDLKRELEGAGYVVHRIAGINNLPASYLRHLGVAGIVMDLLLTRFFTSLSLKKGTYLLAICKKADCSPGEQAQNEINSLSDRILVSRTFRLWRREGLSRALAHVGRFLTTNWHDLIHFKMEGYIAKADLKEFHDSADAAGRLAAHDLSFAKLEAGQTLPDFCYGINAAEINRRISAGHRCFVLKRGDEVVSSLWAGTGRIHYSGKSVYLYSDSLRFTLNPNQAWIYDTIVKPGERRKGYATALYHEVLQSLKHAGIDQVLATVGSDNAGGIVCMTRNHVRLGEKIRYRRFLYLLGWRRVMKAQGSK
jgi:SAM-dependent methyltransferase